jgi:hypothetical protein
MRITADLTGGKPIAALLQSISGVSAILVLVFFTFYDIHGRKREVLLFYLLFLIQRYVEYGAYSSVVKNTLIVQQKFVLNPKEG